MFIYNVRLTNKATTRTCPKTSCGPCALGKRCKNGTRVSNSVPSILTRENKMFENLCLTHPRKLLYLLLTSTLFFPCPELNVPSVFEWCSTGFCLLLFLISLPETYRSYPTSLHYRRDSCHTHRFHSLHNFVPLFLVWLTFPSGSKCKQNA